jgi:tungstate transport system substrate-binding protein
MLRRALVVILLLAGLVPAVAQERRVVLAATTSIQDSGLFDFLAAAYRERTGNSLMLVSRPTTVALATARNGFVDVVIGNSPAALDRFMDDGDGSRRIKMMFDDFVIVGPSDDPAGIRGKDAAHALKAIARKRAIFVSRGDNSGTHVLESFLWDAAGVNPKARSGNWYRETGLGMGLSLGMATRLNGYILVDRGTWLAHAEQGRREILVEGDPRLFNQYELIVLNSQKYPNIDPAVGSRFADWIASDDGQALIAKFTIGGRQVFFPNAKGQN